ncbi:MAG: lysophospholipid acyltransferase family protein [Acidobacteria bacterium]|nr:lysophospholipid acyltransferase family protein [Acidobacteriota bacterium]
MNPKLQAFLIPRVASAFMRLLHSTVRVRHAYAGRIEEMNKSGRPYLLSFWHRYLLLMVFSRHRKPIIVMISRHKDGELIAKTMERFGVTAARGSSTRGGGAALREMVECAERGENIAITPDGPKGPALIAQTGVVLAAQRTGAPVLPVAVISDRKKVLRSWDGFEIPKPLSRVMFVYGEPIDVPRELDSEGVESWRLKIENAMRALTDDAQHDFDRVWRDAKR